MPTIERFEDLEAWKIAREVSNEIYRLSRTGVLARDFGLRDQICRAATSVMSNIAEGFERDGDKEFANFLSLAKGSLGEVRSQLYIAFDQEYITEQEFSEVYRKTQENSRMVAGLISYLRSSAVKGLKFR